MTIKCDMVQVVHGTMAEQGSPTTLAVFQFAFVRRARRARFKSVEITFVFTTGEVQDIAPQHTFVVMPSTTTREVTHSVSPTLEAAYGPVKASVGYTWQQTDTTTSLTDYTYITGLIKSLRAKDGPKRPANAVIWTLKENGQTKSGIPHFIQTALLLKRNKPLLGTPQAGFTAKVSIRADVDSKTSAKEAGESFKGQFSGRSQKGRDIIFNPLVSRGDLQNTNTLGRKKLSVFQMLWQFPD
ncbi:hypothetical protein GGS23DRAFT_550487 [Durotheca rogersii]|uniref:uncharacterized protein n=1 Tax=Durotheca rogersii TaxID=419775 RepID=UPI002221051A|nr:uncharacterized protein GGS23DRAFT_550487 [Durotheca rogersii]KAI5866399.1 hypothetical protein GGS23DRAFT_550487 [Durotheca rogersii]